MTVFARFGSTNMILPPEGPKVFPMVLDFTTQDRQETDFGPYIGEGNEVSFLQGFFADNSRNDENLSVTSQNINHTIVIPPRTMGYMMMFISPTNGLLIWETVAAVNLTVPIVVTNCPVTPYLWGVTQ